MCFLHVHQEMQESPPARCFVFQPDYFHAWDLHTALGGSVWSFISSAMRIPSVSCCWTCDDNQPSELSQRLALLCDRLLLHLSFSSPVMRLRSFEIVRFAFPVHCWLGCRSILGHHHRAITALSFVVASEDQPWCVYALSFSWTGMMSPNTWWLISRTLRSYWFQLTNFLSLPVHFHSLDSRGSLFLVFTAFL